MNLRRKQITVLLGDPTLEDQVKPNARFDEDDYDVINKLKEALASLGEVYHFQYITDHEHLFEEISYLKGKVDLILNLCDEGWKNVPRFELHIPALLDVMQIPYTGANPACLANCYDKSLVRGGAKELSISVPQGVLLMPGESSDQTQVSFPCIVKPNFGDGSFGITQDNIAFTRPQLSKVVAHVRSLVGNDQPILIEEFLEGAEINVGILGNIDQDYLVLPLLEYDYSALPPSMPKICSYEIKWFCTTPPYHLYKSKLADIPDELRKSLMADSIKLFQRFGCRDYARFDWRLDQQGTPKLLEINPNPGWCWDSHMTDMCAAVGISYSEMLKKIIEAAEKRYFIQARNCSQSS